MPLGPAPVPPGSALSAPANLPNVRAGSKPKRIGRRSTPRLQGAAGALVASSDDVSKPPHADASVVQAHAAREYERQQQHLQALEMRQQQQLHRLGAGGAAYERLEAAGMPLP